MMEFLSLVMKPFLLLHLSLQFVTRTICCAIQTWIDFLRTVLFLHLVMLWQIAILPVAVLSLPIRALTALYRQRMMEMHMQTMRKALENALWDRKVLKEQLESAIHDRKMMEIMLMELEDEHDEAILHVELLVREVGELKDEIQRLKQVWSNNRGRGKIENVDHLKAPSLCNLPGDQNNDLNDTMHKIHEHFELTNGDMSSIDLIIKGKTDILARQRAIALSRSLFSATLSLIVGIVAWEAGDPCFPLVTALFAVVGMSLVSVVRFSSTLEHKPAHDAVALLSLNCFLLGMLAYPTLPRVVRVLATTTHM